MRLNACDKTPIKIDDSPLEEVKSFTYLGSVVNDASGLDSNIMCNKARSISPKTKLRRYNSNVKTVLQYGAETWRVTKNAFGKIQTFANQYLRRILGIRWQEKVTNEDVEKSQPVADGDAG